MKKLLTLFTGLLLCLHMTAAQRSLEEAQQAASMYFTSHSNVLRAPSRGATMQHSWTELTDQGTPAFYVFNRGTDDGFVIVSAESRTRTIIGYSDKGHLDQNDMPVNMRTWLEGYKPFIQQVAALPERPTPILGVPTRRATKSYTPISPICTTTWGQRQPYNLNCPLDSDGETCVTGCVATAAAQIMKVHQHPTQGIGSSSYEWTRSDGSTQTLSSNYASHTYDWAHMKDDYQNSSSTTTEQNAVALLMSDCGIACEMDYSSNESSAYFKKMMLAMVNHFGYDPAIRTIVLDYMSEEAFVDAIYVDLQAGRPVYFSGRTIYNEGHAFVGDGIDTDGLVHINWGWNGSSDGYFMVSVLAPGSGYNFKFGQDAIFGVVPAHDADLVPGVLYVRGIMHPDTYTLPRGEKVNVNFSDIYVEGNLMDTAGVDYSGYWPAIYDMIPMELRVFDSVIRFTSVVGDQRHPASSSCLTLPSVRANMR